MKRTLFTVLAMGITLMLQAAKFNEIVTITVGDETREYWLYVPSKATDNSPLVISLHGAGGHDTDKSPFRTDVADKAGCIVAYPQGKMTAFPGLGGMQTYGWSAYGETNFDTEFLLAVIEDIASKYSVDRQRIYCCGFSNGGMMTYVMAHNYSNVFAAFASISGYPINEFHLHHTGWRPVPFLHIHGKADDFVRYSLVGNIIDDMVARNGANPVPKQTTKSGKYTKSVYAAADNSFPVIFYEIDGMGHSDYTTNTEVNSSAQTMWNFFKQYTLSTPCDTTLKWSPRIEEEGFQPTDHGFVINKGTTLLRFGGDQKTDANQNVYRSLQLTTGYYRLQFRATGADGTQMTVMLRKLTGKKQSVLRETVESGKTITLPFSVTDGWGEYQLSILRKSQGATITIDSLQLRSISEKEWLNRDTVPLGIHTLTDDALEANNLSASANSPIYNLQGECISSSSDWSLLPQGMYIVGKQKIMKK